MLRGWPTRICARWRIAAVGQALRASGGAGCGSPGICTVARRGVGGGGACGSGGAAGRGAGDAGKRSQSGGLRAARIWWLGAARRTEVVASWWWLIFWPLRARVTAARNRDGPWPGWCSSVSCQHGAWFGAVAGATSGGPPPGRASMDLLSYVAGEPPLAPVRCGWLQRLRRGLFGGGDGGWQPVNSARCGWSRPWRGVWKLGGMVGLVRAGIRRGYVERKLGSDCLS